jgi:phosphoglycerate dehydrogenase-like enzyme
MDEVTLLVLADPAQPELQMLQRLPKSTRVITGNRYSDLAAAAPSADVLFSWFGNKELMKKLWPLASRLVWVHSLTAGLDAVLFPELVESPVPLTNSRGAFSQTLGEFVIASILFFAKDLRRMVRNQAAGAWAPFDVEEVRRQTLGVVGYGDIGRAIAQRAKGLGMKVLALRRRPEPSASDPFVDEFVPPGNKLDLLRRSDYVAIAAPLTEETRGMIGEAEIRAMKSTAVVINVGRGPVILERALVKALEEGTIRGAALDVFNVEPLPAGHPFFKLDNLLLSPHCADHTSGWIEGAIEIFLGNFERFRKGEALRNVVDKKLGY